MMQTGGLALLPLEEEPHTHQRILKALHSKTSLTVGLFYILCLSLHTLVNQDQINASYEL